MSMSQSEEFFECGQCGMAFFSQEELDEHVRQHERMAEVFRCEECKVTFDTKEELEKHVLEVHSKAEG